MTAKDRDKGSMSGKDTVERRILILLSTETKGELEVKTKTETKGERETKTETKGQ